MSNQEAATAKERRPRRPGRGRPAGLPTRNGESSSAAKTTTRLPSSALFVVSALVLLALTFGVAFTRSSSFTSLGDLPAGAVLINDLDPANNPEVKLDLSLPLTIAGTTEPGSVHRLRIEFSAIGVPLGSGTSDVRQGDDGSYSVRIDSTEAARYFVGGRATGRVSLLGSEDPATGRRPARSRTFSVDAGHSRLRTVPGAIAVILTLFLLAYVKSSLYWLMHGERRGFESTNLVVGGILAGLTAVIIAWLFGGPEPTPGGLAVCAFLGAMAGAATALGGFRIAQRRASAAT